MATIAYNTSKGADINFTRALAAEWGKYNINVNAICPGFFPSKMSAGLLGQIEKMVIAMTPLQRIGGDEDLMGTVVFLAPGLTPRHRAVSPSMEARAAADYDARTPISIEARLPSRHLHDGPQCFVAGSATRPDRRNTSRRRLMHCQRGVVPRAGRISRRRLTPCSRSARRNAGWHGRGRNRQFLTMSFTCDSMRAASASYWASVSRS
jgi:hypothetical protein